MIPQVTFDRTQHQVQLRFTTFLVLASLIGAPYTSSISSAEQFEGQFFHGEGDVEYLELLDISRRMFAADPEFQNVGMLYIPKWNGLVEGPTWDVWWIQNSYGPTYCIHRETTLQRLNVRQRLRGLNTDYSSSWRHR